MSNWSLNVWDPNSMRPPTEWGPQQNGAQGKVPQLPPPVGGPAFINVTDDLVLLEDFNFNDINWECLYRCIPYSAKFCEIIFDLNLCQLISGPTHIHGNNYT